MKPRSIPSSFTFLFLITMLLFISCKKDDDDPITVPFTGTFTTTNEVLAAPPMLKQRITGTGSSAGHGINKFVALATVNLTTAPPFAVTGTATFEADGGDTFFTNFTGTSTHGAGGVSNVALTHTVAGGTGKFENATGSFTGQAVANPAQPTGSITYDGSFTRRR